MKKLLILLLLLPSLAFGDRLINNSTSPERTRGTIFAERFESQTNTEANNGTVTSAPTFDYKAGLSTDGIDDKIAYPTKSGVKSISFWVTLATTTEDIAQLSASHSIEAVSGTLTATGVTSPTFYVNGAATATITTAKSHVVITTATAFDADDITVGADDDFGELTISDFKLWDAVLTAQEAADLANDATYTYQKLAEIDLPMRLAQHDTGNNRTLDVSGNDNHMFLGANGTPASDDPTKLSNIPGYSFDGINDFLYDNYAATVISGFTAIVVFAPDTKPLDDTNNWIFSTISSDFSVRHRNTAASNFLENNVGDTGLVSYSVATYNPYWNVGSKNIAVLTAIDGRLNFWLNGTQLTSDSATAWADGDFIEFAVGSNTGNTVPFDGNIYYIQIYFQELTPLQALDAHMHVRKNTQEP